MQELGSYLLIGFIIMLISRNYARKDPVSWNRNSEYNGASLAFIWLAWPIFLVMLIVIGLGDKVKK